MGLLWFNYPVASEIQYFVLLRLKGLVYACRAYWVTIEPMKNEQSSIIQKNRKC